MKGLFLSALILFSTLLAQAQKPDCPDGWHAVEDPPGNWFCELIDKICPGTNRGYHDIPTGSLKCCIPSSRQLIIYDQPNNLGICCDAGKVYLGAAPNGACCNPGQLLKDGACVDPPPPGPQTGCPSQPANACRLKKACGTSERNGLQYGSCYQINFPTPKNPQLGRGAGNQYTMGGYIQSIPYKICKTTTDCGNGPVGADDVFSIQDTIGLLNDATSALAWISNDVTTNPATATPALLTAVTAAASAGKFKGHTSCSACKCIVALTGATNGLTLRGAGLAGADEDYTLTFTPNKQAIVDFTFNEIPCDGRVVYDDAAAAAQTLTKGFPGQLNVGQVPLKV